MSHIAVDLKVIEVDAPAAARAAGVEEDRVLGGLVRLWHRCWSKKTDIASRVALCGVFGPGQADQLFAALVEFGLLEARDDGDFRVKGADRYLRIQAGREKGGKAASGNLKRGKESPAASRLPPGSPPADAPAGPRLLSGLSPSTEHRAPNTEEAKTLVDQEAGRPPSDVVEVFEHWRTVMATPRSILDKKRRAAVQARLAEGRTVEDLKSAIDGCAKTPHNMGVNDRGEKFNDLELICRNGPNVERFMRNAQAPPRGAGTSAPLEQHTHTGRLEL